MPSKLLVPSLLAHTHPVVRACDDNSGGTILQATHEKRDNVRRKTVKKEIRDKKAELHSLKHQLLHRSKVVNIDDTKVIIIMFIECYFPKHLIETHLPLSVAWWRQ
jgi:hypothetical protein